MKGLTSNGFQPYHSFMPCKRAKYLMGPNKSQSCRSSNRRQSRGQAKQSWEEPQPRVRNLRQWSQTPVHIRIYKGTCSEPDFWVPSYIWWMKMSWRTYILTKLKNCWPRSTRKFRKTGKSSMCLISCSKIKVIHHKTRLCRSKSGEKKITSQHA